MTTSIPRLELVRDELAETVATADKRTAAEQRSLIARLLAAAFEARRASVSGSRSGWRSGSRSGWRSGSLSG